MNNKRKVLSACRWWWWTDDLETLCSGNGYGLPDVIWERWQFTIAVLIWFYLISNTCWFQKHTYRYIPHTHPYGQPHIYIHLWSTMIYNIIVQVLKWGLRSSILCSWGNLIQIYRFNRANVSGCTASLRTVCKQWLVLLMRALFACSGAFVCHGWSFLIEPLLLHQRI